MQIDILWIILSFLAAIVSAGIYLVNQYFKLPGHTLVFWMRLFILIGFLPFLNYINWPDNINFYIAVAVTGILASLGDIRLYNITAVYGAGVTARLQPLMLWVAFFVWFIFDPQLLFEYFEHPYKSSGILLSLFGCVYFAAHLKKCPISKAVFFKISPAVAGYGLNMALAKYAFDNSSLHSGVFAYIIVQTIIAIPVSGFFLWQAQPSKDQENTPKPPLKKILIVSFILTFFWMAHMICKNYANSFAENPAYVAALILTAPVWISLAYKLVGHKEDANVVSGMGIVLCSILLSILTLS